MLHSARSSSSFLKNSGSSPNSDSINCCADIGVPSGCQNAVDIMCSIARSFPSASLTVAFFLHTHDRWEQTSHGSFTHTHGRWPHSPQGRGGALTHTHGDEWHFP